LHTTGQAVDTWVAFKKNDCSQYLYADVTSWTLVQSPFLMNSTTDGALARTLLQAWQGAIGLLTRGLPLPDAGEPDKAPADTGEALSQRADRLTITIGFGPSLFDARFGLADQRPAALVDLPAFTGDAIDPARSNGDLSVQCCAETRLVAEHGACNIKVITSSRAMQSLGVFACAVVMEPSCPVFMACNMSKASPPRHSPTTMRSGLIRRQFFTNSRIETDPLPSEFGGLDSKDIKWGLASCNSAASSTVTMRSSSGM
jgi:hypothetical protein